MTNPIIIGAGMAGLLAANMLRRHNPEVVERQSSLPNNHHGVLRFRTLRVSEQTHIPFREVQVFKGVDESDPIRAALQYSCKVTKGYEVRSLISLEPCMRYIAPDNFIEQMASGLTIGYGVDGLKYLLPDNRQDVGPIVSTLPMPMLMDATEYDGPRPDFRSLPGWSVSATIDNCDVFVTRYFTNTMKQYYRASITGNILNVEFAGEKPAVSAAHFEQLVRDAVCSFGIFPDRILSVHEPKTSQYAKLATFSKEDRQKAKDFMFWATNQLGIFSLGRFATWRSGLLMDDVVDDVLKIERWMMQGNYERQKDL